LVIFHAIKLPFLGGIAGLFALMILLPLPARAGEFEYHPSLAVSEEFNDNVYESAFDRRTDYITRILPGLALRYNAPLWDWDVSYLFDYRYYARNSREDDTTHNLTAHGLTRIINDLLFLDISDTYQRVSLDINRDYTQESLFVNQTDSNTFTVSPYFVFHPGAKVTVNTGYRYTNIWYRDPQAEDNREHTGFANAAYQYSDKLSLSVAYSFTRHDSNEGYYRHTAFAGARYEYADRCFVFGQGGYTLFDFDDSRSTSNPYWSAGITHVRDPYTFTFSTSVSYPSDPLADVTEQTVYAASVTRAFQRGSLGVTFSYSELRDPFTDTRTESSYSGGFTGRYELSENLVGTFGFSAERYEGDDLNGNSWRFYVNPGLSYTFPREITLALNYYFVDSSSDNLSNDDYRVNRVVLEARKTF
jgi:hypothetical protein